jgi:hypothetical protein
VLPLGSITLVLSMTPGSFERVNITSGFASISLCSLFMNTPSGSDPKGGSELVNSTQQGEQARLHSGPS